jgi:DNA-binding NarL/FixJ family response regulator
VGAFAAWGAPGLLVAAGQEVVPLLRGLDSATAAAALRTLDVEARPAAVAIPDRPDVLSGREVEVLRLLDAGASNKDIAESLVLSANTVKTHIRNVLAKLGARSRGEAVAIARRHHLL